MLVATGSLESDEPPVRLLEHQVARFWYERSWFGTSEALYWTDGSKLYSRSLQP